jgi:hypothetical protein
MTLVIGFRQDASVIASLGSLETVAGSASSLKLERIFPMAILSNTDALLVAVPMIGTLVVGFFRLDELFGKPRKRPVRGHQLAGMDARGRVTCLDPDGTVVPCAGESLTISALGSAKRLARRPRPEAGRE